MKYLIKRFWLLILIAFVINIPLLVLGVIPTNNTLTLKGDTTKINSFLEIDGAYEEKGSFSSIYVISYDHSTILQNFFIDLDPIASRSEISESYTHLTRAEQNQAGQIQKKSSIDNALIVAFTRAKNKRNDIIFDYKFKSVCVSWYNKESNLRIGDEIIYIDDVGVGDEALFLDAYANSNEKSLFTVIRNNEEIVIERGKGGISGYRYYDINYAAVSPKITIKSTNTGGPSAGFLQAISLYNRLIPDDLTKGLKIAGTGTINVSGDVGAIGGIKQKVATAFDDNMDIFFCPKANEEDGRIAYNTIKNKEKMKFIVIETIDDAIRELESFD